MTRHHKRLKTVRGKILEFDNNKWLASIACFSCLEVRRGEVEGRVQTPFYKFGMEEKIKEDLVQKFEEGQNQEFKELTIDFLSIPKIFIQV